jgi:hypothetical protein
LCSQPSQLFRSTLVELPSNFSWFSISQGRPTMRKKS